MQPAGPLLSSLQPATHITPSYLFKIDFNIVLPSMSMSSKCSSSQVFPPKFLYAFHFHLMHAAYRAYLILLDMNIQIGLSLINCVT